jgi:hypothetical protein
MNGFYIILRNSLGCEIYRTFTEKRDDIEAMIVELLHDSGGMDAGDTLSVEEGWQED